MTPSNSQAQIIPENHSMSSVRLHHLLGWLPASLLLLCVPETSFAAHGVQWVTNYYSVTGATLSEIRQSMRQSRPWKDRKDLDGFTEWNVAWTFSTTATATGCRCSTFATQTRVVITLPKWVKPADASPETADSWKQYADALALHETGHGRHAILASTQLQRGMQSIGERPTCEALKQAINELGDRTITEFRRKDEDYDRETRHGATQGARFPGRNRPPRRRIRRRSRLSRCH